MFATIKHHTQRLSMYCGICALCTMCVYNIHGLVFIEKMYGKKIRVRSKIGKIRIIVVDGFRKKVYLKFLENKATNPQPHKEKPESV